MKRVACVAFLTAVVAYAVGCSRRSLTYAPDGGGFDLAGAPCGSLTPAACDLDPGCELRAGCCGGGSACVPVGSPPTHCAECPACANLDESSCKLASLCRADYCLECSCTPTFVACVPVGAPKTTCPGLGCAQPSCNCDGLDEKTCIASESTLGCTADYCPDCHGGQTYSGCSGPTEGAPACPGNACPAGCRANGDCTSGQLCVQPGGSAGCGVCAQGQACTVDKDCSAGNVCESAPCVCTSTGKSCVPACTSTSCPDGQQCGSDGHCQAIPCSTSSPCPTFFQCLYPPGPGMPYCSRKSCQVDADCAPNGYCVDNACFGTLGMCAYPAA